MNPEQISLKVTKECLSFCVQIFSSGFKIRCQNGQTLNQFLFNELGFEQNYIDHRIQTVFLNGKAVDNTHSAQVQDGSMIALSAAMPGLVGATLRKGGHYSILRKNITCDDQPPNGCESEGIVYVKLFNLIAKEIGPDFLRQGILMDTDELDAWLKQYHEILWDGCISVEYGNQEFDTGILSNIPWKSEETILKANQG